ncbi:MAG: Type 1 glutamine amidotransferase-like domain-containing protein [Oscillospiraceae bacterium]|nr:Type 1 glutamine amidotransferase-like domain-containing protein [Oscillospiraceae bacterium]MCL2278714.1 Type 1 glutamine amidotransferase-like domain-containing protein [Oscillospiraceae bacterium]
MQTHNNWCNVLLTDSGFYYDGELDKPLDLLINSFKAMLQKPFAETSVLFIPTASMQNELKAIKITNRLKNELLAIGISSDNITVHDIDGSLSEENAMKFDVIYFTGGKTPYLAQRVFETGFDKIIKKMIFANKVYIGMSAGSMLLMSNFNVDDPNNPKFNGLGVIEAYGSAHCDDNIQIRTDLPLPHIALRENQALKLSWNGYELLDGNLQYLG